MEGGPALLEQQVAERVDDEQLGLGEEGELVVELAAGLSPGECAEVCRRGDDLYRVARTRRRRGQAPWRGQPGVDQAAWR